MLRNKKLLTKVLVFLIGVTTIANLYEAEMVSGLFCFCVNMFVLVGGYQTDSKLWLQDVKRKRAHLTSLTASFALL